MEKTTLAPHGRVASLGTKVNCPPNHMIVLDIPVMVDELSGSEPALSQDLGIARQASSRSVNLSSPRSKAQVIPNGVLPSSTDRFSVYDFIDGDTESISLPPDRTKEFQHWDSTNGPARNTSTTTIGGSEDPRFHRVPTIGIKQLPGSSQRKRYNQQDLIELANLMNLIDQDVIFTIPPKANRGRSSNKDGLASRGLDASDGMERSLRITGKLVPPPTRIQGGYLATKPPQENHTADFLAKEVAHEVLVPPPTRVGAGYLTAPPSKSNHSGEGRIIQCNPSHTNTPDHTFLRREVAHEVLVPPPTRVGAGYLTAPPSKSSHSGEGRIIQCNPLHTNTPDHTFLRREVAHEVLVPPPTRVSAGYLTAPPLKSSHSGEERIIQCNPSHTNTPVHTFLSREVAHEVLVNPPTRGTSGYLTTPPSSSSHKGEERIGHCNLSHVNTSAHNTLAREVVSESLVPPPPPPRRVTAGYLSAPPTSSPMGGDKSRNWSPLRDETEVYPFVKREDVYEELIPPQIGITDGYLRSPSTSGHKEEHTNRNWSPTRMETRVEALGHSSDSGLHSNSSVNSWNTVHGQGTSTVQRLPSRDCQGYSPSALNRRLKKGEIGEINFETNLYDSFTDYNIEQNLAITPPDSPSRQVLLHQQAERVFEECAAYMNGSE